LVTKPEPTPSCATQPNYEHANFTTWTPTQTNQPWLKKQQGVTGCYYECKDWYTWDKCEIPPTPPITYTWTPWEWWSCNKECGWWERSREVVCKNSLWAVVADILCTWEKPAEKEACNTHPCTPWDPSCVDMKVDVNRTNRTANISCNWTNVNSFKLDCWNGGALIDLGVNETKTCTYSSATTYTAKCLPNGNNYNICTREFSLIWWWSWWGGGGGGWSTLLPDDCWQPNRYIPDPEFDRSPSYYDRSCGDITPIQTHCWDWKVQRPNSDWILEECDWQSGWCDSRCKIIDPQTFPSEWVIKLWPKYERIVIWNEMWVFGTYDIEQPYIKNLTSSDIYLWAFWGVNQLCIYKRGWEILNWTNRCINIGNNDVLEVNANISMRDVEYTWNISAIGAGRTFADVDLITTLWKNNAPYDRNVDIWFDAKLPVRVVKPSVWTTGGWTSYINGWSNISDIKEVNDKDWNENFTGPSVWDLSSSTTTTDEANTSDDKITIEWSWSTADNTWSLNEFRDYNWIKNAVVLENKNFEIWELFNSWAITYIVENGDLYIAQNIIYSDNIAFVVKWWNIIVDSNVENIKWTFIAIPKWDTWWEIKWTNNTTNRLKVDGSLYWNIKPLLKTRTYIKQDNNWLLNIWTIVSFGSSVFRSPAPLVNTFINEYLKATKVAQ
jgi:hypothetical protein